MSLRWRVALVAIIAAAVVGSLVPHTALSGAETTGAQMVQVVESPLGTPFGCADAVCGKGSPAPAAPSPGVVLAVVLGGLAAARVTASLARRHRTQAVPLPAGARDPLFHPPQFS